MYGVQYHDKLCDTIRRAAEFCDGLQCFFVFHSMGGGMCTCINKTYIGTFKILCGALFINSMYCVVAYISSKDNNPLPLFAMFDIGNSDMSVSTRTNLNLCAIG